MRAVLMLGALALGISCAIAPAHAACDPKNPSFVCGLKYPEDLVHLRGSQWVVASSADKETKPPLMAIRTDTREVTPLFPIPANAADWDSKTYPDCKEPPKAVSSIGLNVKQLGKDKYRLFVVNRGDRFGVEIVDIAVSGKELKATWRGCVVAPEGTPPPNAVAPLDDGGILLSGMGLQSWRPGKGWAKVGDVKGSNGVDTSADGKTIYVNDVMARTLSKLDVDGKVLASTPKLDFNPDNLRWGDDGALYIAGASPTGTEWVAGCMKGTMCDVSFIGARVDPATLALTEIVRSEGFKGAFGAGTTALKIGDQIWFGSFRGDRAYIHTLKK